MKNKWEIINCLKSLNALLKEEKVVLINNDAEKLAKIVSKKQELVEIISLIDTKQLQVDDKTKGLMEEIQSLQETNILLTNQALSFQNALLEAISHNIKSLSNTYSQKGQLYSKENNSKIIDQSV